MKILFKDMTLYHSIIMNNQNEVMKNDNEIVKNNEIVKPKRGRPRVLSDRERVERKTKYMLTKMYYCVCCKREYNMASITQHNRTNIHRNNSLNYYEGGD